MKNDKNEKLLGFKELQEVIPLGRTRLYELINNGLLPQPLKIGKRSFFKNSEIQKFIKNLEKENG